MKKKQNKDLIQKWQNTRRAFAILGNESNRYSAISARKMLEIGTKCQTDVSASSMPKKKIITFTPDDTLGNIINRMFEHKTRRLILENSNQFISDRLILDEISRILKFQKDVDNFWDIPASRLKFGHVREIKDDLTFDRLCTMMEKMEHPYVKYKDIAISPWDVCVTLMSENLHGPLVAGHHKKCPHCGKDIGQI